VRQPQPVQQPEVVEERVDFVRPIETLSPACKYAIDEFNRIYARYQSLTKQDVWTGMLREFVCLFVFVCFYIRILFCLF
jgi:hypothetical protein